MNPTYHRPLNVEAHPVHWTGRATENLYGLRLQYRPGGEWHALVAVHVPPGLAPHFQRGNVAGFHLETLDLQGFASKLPGCPRFVVLGVHSADGREHVSIPREFKLTRRLRAVGGLLTLLASAASYAAAPAAAGVLFAGTISLLYSAYSAVPTPFKVVREVA